MSLQRFANAPIPSSPNTAWTFLSGAINASTTTVTPLSNAPFPAVQFDILVEDEIMQVTASAAGVWTVVRGAEGTTATSHSDGAGIYHVLSAGALNRIPRSMTTAGDMEYLNSAGAPARLAAPSNGEYAVTFTGGVPSWTTLPPISGLTTANFASANVSQWTNDASYTTLAAVAGVGYLTPSNAANLTNKTGNISQWTNDSGYLTSVTNITGNAGTATKWATARNLAGNSVDGSANVAFANAFIVQGTTDAGLSGAQFLGALATGIVKNTTTTGVLSIAVAADFPTLNQSTSGNAATATALATARAINGVNFDGTTAITVTAAAGTLTGATLAVNVLASSLTSFGGSPTIITPTIASFTNATHSHLNAAGGGTITAAAISDLATATIAFSNKTGNISQWTNDTVYLTSVTAHNLLSATHGDTLTGTVVRGDMIVGNSTPTWARVAIGTVGKVWQSDGADAGWAAPTGTGVPVLATAPTLTGPVTLNGVAGSSGFTLVGATQTSSFPALDISQTWNNAAITFQGIKANFTNTASATTSKLLDLQIGGATHFGIRRTGPNDGYPTLTTTAGGFEFVTNFIAGLSFQLGNGNASIVGVGGPLELGSAAVDYVVLAGVINGGHFTSRLSIPANNIIEQRNSTTAQTWRVYNTWTDASNGEWATFNFASNVLHVGATKNGTGTARPMQLDYGGTTAAAMSVPITSGQVTFGGGLVAGGTVNTGANYIELDAMTGPAAPGASKARFYSDNSGGKERIMVIFPSGAAQQIAIEP